MLTSRFVLGLIVLLTRAYALLDIAKNIVLSKKMQSVVEPLSRQAIELFSSDTPLALEYSIFSGISALPKLPLVYTGSKAFIALQLLIERKIDAAHEVVLGVDWNNFKEAEYAATNRGQANWTQDHPFSDEDDMVHSIIHRLEGDLKGEGGFTGWDNAKYWAAGGPKMHKCVGNHPVHQALRRLCGKLAPTLEHLLVASKKRQHEIIAGGGKLRTLWVEEGCFDPISFIALCQYTDWTDELKNIQVAETLLLIRLELLKICGKSSSQMLD
jgi:hypothetical protein